MRAAAAVIPLLLLAGCAEAGSAETGGKCEVQQVAAYDLPKRRALVFVPVTIDGRQTQALLDTGAEKSAVGVDLAAKLDLPADSRHGTTVVGVGGLGTLRKDVMVRQFAFAGYDSKTGHYPLLDTPAGLGKSGEFGGLVGGDMLENFDLDLDMRHNKLTVYRVRHCGGHFLPWTETYAAIPLDLTWGHRIVLPVTVDGQPLRAMLDTGATSSVLDSDAADRLGVTEAALKQDPNARGTGAAGAAFSSTLHHFATLDIGPDRFERPGLGIIDRSLRESDMLLGQDYLHLRRVWISYSSRQIFVAAAHD